MMNFAQIPLIHKVKRQVELVQRRAYSTASSTSHSVSFSSPASVGNLMVVWCSFASTTNTMSGPSGWTNPEFRDQGTLNSYMWYRIKQEGDTDSWTFTTTPTVILRIVMYEVTGINQTSPVSATGSNQSGIVGTLAASSAALDVPDNAYAIAFISTAGAITLSSMTNSFASFFPNTGTAGDESGVRSYDADVTAQNTTITWAPNRAVNTGLIVIQP